MTLHFSPFENAKRWRKAGPKKSFKKHIKRMEVSLCHIFLFHIIVLPWCKYFRCCFGLGCLLLHIIITVTEKMEEGRFYYTPSLPLPPPFSIPLVFFLFRLRTPSWISICSPLIGMPLWSPSHSPKKIPLLVSLSGCSAGRRILFFWPDSLTVYFLLVVDAHTLRGILVHESILEGIQRNSGHDPIGDCGNISTAEACLSIFPIMYELIKLIENGTLTTCLCGEIIFDSGTRGWFFFL